MLWQILQVFPSNPQMLYVCQSQAPQSGVGHRHPDSIALEEVERIFVGMGYEVVEGPEVADQ